MNQVEITREALKQALIDVRGDFEKIANRRGGYVEFGEQANHFAKRVLSSKNDGVYSLTLVNVDTLIKCFLRIAHTGLSIDPAKGFLFVKAVYSDQTRQTTCALEHGYKGLLKLIKRSQKVKAITADVIYENDHFEFHGSREKVTHRVTTLSRTKRGNCDGGYCTSELVNGGFITTTMAAEELEELQAQGAMYENSVWSSPFVDEMRRKSLIKRHYKTLQASIEDDFIDMFDEEPDTADDVRQAAQGL